MHALILGGSGLISSGIAGLLSDSGHRVTVFHRGDRPPVAGVEILLGDRNSSADLAAARDAAQFDVVIDMICFTPKHADASIKLFAGRCKQFIFCSTVCTYGGGIPPHVRVNETFEQKPVSQYGRDKVACETKFLEAHTRGDFGVTIVRPSSTYGPGGRLIDNLESEPVSWDRVERGLPVLCAGDGLGLWVSTYRDDCGKLFAYASLNEKTFGQAYNATRDTIYTWRDLYREAATALGREAHVLFVPADWVVAHDPRRFGLLNEITRYHGAYDSSKAKADVPEFNCEVDYVGGAKRTIEDMRRRGAWKTGVGDTLYDTMVEKALAFGVKPVTV